jgi:hypothetical protein
MSDGGEGREAARAGLSSLGSGRKLQHIKIARNQNVTISEKSSKGLAEHEKMPSR